MFTLTFDEQQSKVIKEYAASKNINPSELFYNLVIKSMEEEKRKKTNMKLIEDLTAIRKRAIKNGLRLLTIDEILNEINEART